MNLLDRAIAAVAPTRALRRVEARARLARLNAVQNLYEAASGGRRTQHWRASMLDANGEVGAAHARVRAVARDMVRNNAFAARAKTTITHNVVGAGIIPRVQSDNAKAADLIRAHFDTTAIDADGRNTLYGLQELAMATVVEAGEVLIRYRPRDPKDGLPLPFQLQVLEPDYLDTTKTGPLPNGNYAIQGVEFDLIGRRVAYHIFTNHPGGEMISVNAPTTTRVSADFIAHVFRVDRPGQARGISWFSPVVLRLRDFADFADAQLIRQKIAACFAAFITTTGDAGLGDDEGLGYPLESFEPGMIERLREGESVQFATPPTTQDFDAYSRTTLREIAAGLGVTYEALTGDLTGVNYSSGRMGWLEYQRNIDAWRWNMLIPQMLQPIARWTQNAITLATNSSAPVTLSWTPPRREMIDPTVETEAAKNSIRSGLSSRSEEIRRLGFDPLEVDDEIEQDNLRADEKGLIFDSDPRKVTTRGVAQKSADPNAPDAVDQAAN